MTMRSSFVLLVISMAAAFWLVLASTGRSSSSSALMEQSSLRQDPLSRQLEAESRHLVEEGASDAAKCNGHANLCAQRANDAMFATLHNANNALLDGSWLLPNHKLSLRTALKGGYRGINMDIGVCGGEVVLLHGTCIGRSKVTLAKMLEDIVAFLDEPDNENEVLLMPTEFAETGFLGDNEAATLEDVEAIFQQVDGFKEKLYDHAATLANDPAAPWPTLQELIDVDQRIIFFHYNAIECTPNVDCPAGWNPWFDYAVETKFSFPCVWNFWPKDEACNLDPRGEEGTREFFGVNVFVTPPLFGVWTPWLVLHKKEFLVRHINACRNENDLQVNAILVDFGLVGDVIEVVDGYNSGL